MSWQSIIFKGLLKRRKQTLIMISGTILSVLMITAVLSSFQGMQKSIKENMANYGEPYILTHQNKIEQISYRGVPLLIESGEQAEKLTKKQFKALKTNRNQRFIGISPRAIKTVTNKLDNKKLALVGIDFTEEQKMKPWWQVWGALPKQENEILLGYDVAQKYSLYEGDTVLLSSTDQAEAFRVSGYLHYTGHIDDQLIYTIINHPFFTDGIDFAEAVIPYKGAVHHDAVPAGWSWSKVESTIDERVQIMNDIAKITPYLFVVTVILGAAVIFVTLLSQTEERRKEFSLWRAIGFNRVVIIKLLLMEVLIIAVIGALAGLLSGLLLANVFNGIMSKFHFFADISFQQTCIIFAAAIFVSIITAIFPISLALKQDLLKLLKTNA